MRAHVIGLGAYLPPQVRTNDEWPSDFATRGRADGDRTLVDIPVGLDQAGRISAEYLRAEAADPFLGSVERRIAPDTMTSAESEVLAAEQALSDAGVRADQLDYVISWAIVPDRIAPSGANVVAHALGAKRAIAFGTDAGCATALTQLMTARALVESGQARYVLLTQSHLLTRAFPMMHPVSPSIGDAATAIVVGAESRWPILAAFGATHGDYYDAVTWCRGKEDDSDPPWWLPGGAYYVGSRRSAAAKELMQETVGYGSRTVRELLEQADLSVDKLGLLCSVQPRGWIPQAIVRCLGLGPERTQCSYQRYAHLGGCGPIVNWIEALEDAPARPGPIALYAQGAGFIRVAVLIGEAYR